MLRSVSVHGAFAQLAYRESLRDIVCCLRAMREKLYHMVIRGANRALKSGEKKKNDGLVTAEKILGLRLRGTDMVVLSACETGLGKVRAGEGIYGLRRAFAQAGVRSMVMSMWSVPDKETKELMIEFYKNIKNRYDGAVPSIKASHPETNATRQAKIRTHESLLLGCLRFYG